LRWRGRLDFLLSRVLDRDLEKVEPVVQSILRLGAYQIAMMDHVPAAAAVDQMVRCARTSGASRAAGFVNGVLRHLVRELDSIAPPSLEADPLSHLVHALSLPEWIAARWLRRFGAEGAAALGEACNGRPPTTLRVNCQRGSRSDLVDILRVRFPAVAPCAVASTGLTLGKPLHPGQETSFREGLFSIQDEASQAVIDLLDPQPGEHVLDTCAAPGTKANAIAERVGPGGSVVATDRHERRLSLVGRESRRLGLSNVRAHCLDASIELGQLRADHPEAFDRVLVDAPCSGLGTLRRNPDARWRVRPDDPERLAESQRKLLEQALPWVRPGGALVYSVCTFEPEECEEVVDAFLAAHDNVSLVPKSALPQTLAPWLDAAGYLRSFPHRGGGDGFFAARFEVTS
jgi:16S rRNA (cytosine967-C5)-methyltransferase